LGIEIADMLARWRMAKRETSSFQFVLRNSEANAEKLV
jgi:hypothetical protein